MLKQLIYASTVSKALMASAVEHLASQAAERNSALGVTGVLMFGTAHFVQVLEGRASRINQLYLKIAADARHENVELLSYQDLSKRQYPNWAMGLFPLSDELKDPTGQSRFNPYELDAVGVHLLVARANTRRMLRNETVLPVGA